MTENELNIYEENINNYQYIKARSNITYDFYHWCYFIDKVHYSLLERKRIFKCFFWAYQDTDE
jgi:hypothetical protein